MESRPIAERLSEPSLELVRPALRRAGWMPAVCVAGVLATIGAFAGATVLPYALAAFAVLAYLGCRLVSPRLWRAAAEDVAVAPVELPPVGTIADTTARALLQRIGVARGQIEEALQSEGANGADGRKCLRTVRELERAAVAILARVEFLGSAPAAPPAAGPLPAESLAPDTARVVARTALVREQRKAVMEALAARRLHELARLEFVTASLEALPLELMEVSALKAEAIAGGGLDPVCEADALREDLRNVRREMGAAVRASS